MAKKGMRKYKCNDCGHDQYIHWVELNRASRPRCQRCGSAWLDPASREGRKDRLIGNLNVSEYDPKRGDILRPPERR